jgi:hypothetical protein
MTGIIKPPDLHQTFRIDDIPNFHLMEVIDNLAYRATYILVNRMERERPRRITVELESTITAMHGLLRPVNSEANEKRS